LYWLSLPTVRLIDLLEAEDLLPRWPIPSHIEIEKALAAFMLRKLTRQR
jgi:hypothetical protein